MDRRTQYPVGYLLKSGIVGPDGRRVAARYNGHDVRAGMLRVHDRVGLPHLGIQFENGVWRSRLVVGRKVAGWEFNPWRDVERGLNEEGIILAPRGRAVRHATPGLPRVKIIERVIRSLQERMRPLPGFVGFNHREYKPEVVNDFLGRVTTRKEHPAQMFFSMVQLREAIDAELMAFAAEPQNGRWLPGVSPEEAWLNGIGGFPGISTKPLRKLPDTARHLLSTHWRELPVTERGIRFEVGSKPLVFWGGELLPYKHKTIPVRWNIEEPELLHCLPPGGDVFTLKLRELDSWTATREELAETGAARNRWVKQGKIVFDQLPHKLVRNVTRDTEHSVEVHAVGGAIQRQTDEHRKQKAVTEKAHRRLQSLAGALGIPEGVKNPERAIAAAQRRLSRASEAEVES